MLSRSYCFCIPLRQAWFILYCSLACIALAEESYGQDSDEISAKVGREPEPAWVVPLDVDLAAKTPKNAGDGGIWHLLIDSQIDAKSRTRYEHYAYRFLSESGVQEYSERSIEFDPVCQILTLHRLRIHRNGKIIDRLPNQDIRTLDRESGHEDQLYDGQLTSIMLLEDIRVGDVLEYAYSIKGHNPLFGDHFSRTKRWSWGTTIHRAQYRVLWDRQKLPFIRAENFENNPTIKKTPSGHEVIWEQKNTRPVIEESGLPDDFSPYAWIDIADYKSWDEVRQWARELYQFPDILPGELETKVEEIRRLPNDEKKALAALRYVQDNIRYVGSFMGEHSHKPYEIDTIMTRRFGDCKDKTLTLVTLLKKLGIQAEPALVETDYGKQLADWLPSPFKFDHVVTKLTLEGKIYWIDPTRSFQRGDSLDKIYFPDYGLALVLDETTAGLEAIKSPGFLNPKTQIFEVFTFKDYKGDAHLEVKTEFHGKNADSTRAYFSKNGSETIKDAYVDFYADDYPGISAEGDIIGTDHEDENRYTVTETYLIKDFWTKDDGDTLWDGSFFPRSLYNELDAPNRTERSMPYAVSHLRNIESTLKIVLPSRWEDEEESTKIEDPTFSFSNKAKSKGNVTEVVCRYVSKRSRVPAKDMAEYAKKINQAKDMVGYHFSIRDSYREREAKDLDKKIDLEDLEEDEPYEPNWLANIIVFGSFVFGLLAAGALYFWNPPSRFPLRSKKHGELIVGRGGWMVLVAFGIFVRPLFTTYRLSQSVSDLDLNVWNFLTTSGYENYHILWGPAILGSAMANAFLLPIGILQIILYFQLRTSFPIPVILELVFLFLLTLISAIVYQILPGVGEEAKVETLTQAAKIFLASLVWIPYLLVSKRVRNTFVKRRGKTLVPPPLPVITGEAQAET